MKSKINYYYVISFLLLVLGIVLFAFDLMKGNAKVGVVLIIPFIISGGFYSLIGVFCFIAAFFIFYLGFTRSEAFQNDNHSILSEEDRPGSLDDTGTNKPQTSTKYGGVVLIGPIPIIFGSDKKTLYLSVILGIIFIVITFLVLMYVVHFWNT